MGQISLRSKPQKFDVPSQSSACVITDLYIKVLRVGVHITRKNVNNFYNNLNFLFLASTLFNIGAWVA